jgi:hypothetical protein
MLCYSADRCYFLLLSIRHGIIISSADPKEPHWVRFEILETFPVGVFKYIDHNLVHLYARTQSTPKVTQNYPICHSQIRLFVL